MEGATILVWRATARRMTDEQKQGAGALHENSRGGSANRDNENERRNARTNGPIISRVTHTVCLETGAKDGGKTGAWMNLQEGDKACMLLQT